MGLSCGGRTGGPHGRVSTEVGRPTRLHGGVQAGRRPATAEGRETLAEMSLTGQPYVLDTNVAVEAALKKEGATVLAFHRIAVGEGIEKKEEDFAAEVMKQAGLA